MYNDNDLRLATAEVVPNGGASPGGLGATSVALGLEPGGFTDVLRNYSDIGGGSRMVLNFNVDTAFTCGTFGATLEFQLVSIPIVASLLTNATTSGKRTHIAAVVTSSANDNLTVAAHNLPLGAPIYLSALATTTGVSTNTIYYVVPDGANTFKLATSLANALAGTTIVLGTGAGTATVEFIPTVHASSGGLVLFDVGVPTDQGPLRTGTQFQVPLRMLVGPDPKQALPVGQTDTQPLGAGPLSGLIAANAQRFYYLRYLPSATITAGAVTCDLVIDAGDAKKFAAPGYTVVG